MDADPILAGEGGPGRSASRVDSTAQAELFLYAGKDHLWADSSLPTYDRKAAELMTQRVVEFLSRLD